MQGGRGGAFQSSVQVLSLGTGGARGKAVRGDWVNSVRLASVRASTDCWRRLRPARCSKDWREAPPPPALPPENAPYNPSSPQLQLPLPSEKKKKSPLLHIPLHTPDLFPPPASLPWRPGSHLPIKTSDGKIERQLFAPVI